jgi:Restriction endonuclease XhoI
VLSFEHLFGIRANGLTDAHMMMGRKVLSLPGFFRPTKLWDLLIINQGRLVAALELKSQFASTWPADRVDGLAASGFCA